MKTTPFFAIIAVAACLVGLGLGGCLSGAHKESADQTPRGIIRAVNLVDSARLLPYPGPISLAAARNEWTSFSIQVSDLSPGPVSLRLRPLNLKTANASIGASNFEGFQVMTMPVDVNRAGYVRHTGLPASSGRLPRALLPLHVNGGLINLAALRDPSNPLDPSARFARTSPLHLWIDLHVPADAPAGDYEASCDLLSGGDIRPIASVPLRLTVHDFVLPDQRHLQMISQVSWESLVHHHARDFEAITPRLINRGNPRYAGTIKALDALMQLAHHNRVAIIVPRLQPTVKWPANVENAPPDIDWADFDTVIAPWFSGSAFTDHMPLNYWPLPEPDHLANYDVTSRMSYWSQAATHFDQNDWLSKTSASLEKVTPGRATTADSLELSAEAARLLAAHPRMRVTVPLEDDQIQFADKNNSRLIDPATTSRLLTASPGLVFAQPLQDWPDNVELPGHWLRTDLPGLVPYVGAGGDERDVRLWAWLAFLRQARFVLWGSPLPSLADPKEPADPNELIWFYPGSWFGLDEPVPTVQLKWLRRSQQDYEYLWLAKERGEVINALQMARLITKPVEIQPDQPQDPSYALMSGTTDPDAWGTAGQLLAKSILIRQPGVAPDPDQQRALYIETLRWARPQERPMLMARTARWTVGTGAPAAPGNWLNLQLGIDIYNASDVRPDNNHLQWLGLPPGWEVKPQPVDVSALATYQVRRASLDARFNLDKITPGTREPIELQFVDGFTKIANPLKIVLPVAVSERREGRLDFDGRLDDWTADDLIQDGPMVQMLNRPGLQKQALELASTRSRIYTGWAAENFYVAFALDGISRSSAGGRNFVDYQARRAWGEDLCEVLIQAVYANNQLGPVLHVVCKPNGGNWVERKLNPRQSASPWEPFEAGVRYHAVTSGTNWTGEVAIPWKIFTNANLGSPLLLRFNFAQHRTATGESASWAGPIDFGRDDAFMGALQIHAINAPGMAQRPER